MRMVQKQVAQDLQFCFLSITLRRSCIDCSSKSFMIALIWRLARLAETKAWGGTTADEF